MIYRGVWYFGFAKWFKINILQIPVIDTVINTLTITPNIAKR